MVKIKLTIPEWCVLTGIIIFDSESKCDYNNNIDFSEFLNYCNNCSTNGLNTSIENCKINIQRNINFSL